MKIKTPERLECFVRKAIPEDVGDSLQFCWDFFHESAAKLGQGIKEQDLKEFMLFLVLYEVAYVAVIGDEVVGCIAGSITMNQLKHDEFAFKEVFWYVKPHYRKSKIGRMLYDVLIEELKRKKVDFCIMANRFADQDLGRFFFYHDYKPMETLWIKKIV